jgi:hypothetical protein
MRFPGLYCGSWANGCNVQEPELTPRALREHQQPTRREPALHIERIMS